MKLSERELISIMAALRLWQQTYQKDSKKDILERWPGYFHNCKPLESNEIDEICERFNFELETV